jgi:hypothetical protein
MASCILEGNDSDVIARRPVSFSFPDFAVETAVKNLLTRSSRGGATPNSGGSGLIDCTTVIPAAKPVKRELNNPHAIWGRSGEKSPHAWLN